MPNRKNISSRIAGFYRRPLSERASYVTETGYLSSESANWLAGGGGLAGELADRMSENVVATTGLPLGIGLNFRINHRDYLIPMAVEEPSVVAAASNAARLVRISGGFTGKAEDSIMTAQIQFDQVPDAASVSDRIAAHRAEILAEGNKAIPRMVERGGGCRDLEVRVLDASEGLVVIHVYIDVGDAMGANLVDTVAEAVAPLMHEITGGTLGLRILSNLPLRRMVTVTGLVNAEALGGRELASGIVRASRFAEVDPLRAATHNKGIMNGVDAVAVALGQDWRSIEASAHAYAALSGRYRPLATWNFRADGKECTSDRNRDEGGKLGTGASSELVGELTMPLAVGTVGGATGINPCARAGLELLGLSDARELAVVMAAVGLASNLAALKALAGEGIQRGHMKLHRRRLMAARAGNPDSDRRDQVREGRPE